LKQTVESRKNSALSVRAELAAKPRKVGCVVIFARGQDEPEIDHDD